jgi:hypothetical protein
MMTMTTPRHFFAASFCTWKVDTDIERLIRFMKKEKHPFSLYLVPTSVDTDYDIEFFKPIVEGVVFLTTIHPKEKK